MKKTITPAIAVPLIMFAAIFFSCKKEKGTDLPAAYQKQMQPEKNVATEKIIFPVANGYLTGSILPVEAKAEIMLYGDGEPVQLMTDENGSLGKFIVPAGLYTLIIGPRNTIYGGLTINDLAITENEITVIGQIVLQPISTGEGANGN